MPFESLVSICHEEHILSLIDGAHAMGHIRLSLSSLNPDFFVSNIHKWLFVPRGCAVLYVPVRNQHLIRSSLPTSHGFVSREGNSGRRNPLPPSDKGEFVNNFEFVGTIDNTNYLVIAEAIKWRAQVCGGEEAIITQNTNLAREGGKLVAKILGTSILDNSTETLTNCCLVNVELPLVVSEKPMEGKLTIKEAHADIAREWMQEALMADYKSFLPVFPFQGKWWTRLSGQVYLDLSDFEWAGRRLKELCERVGREEFLNVSDKGSKL
jgi:selenocysteine lyase/cysteine desulfurase